MLTFGWEFAPILSGGLGVACAGLVRAMVAEGAEITFVLPKMPRPIAVDGVAVIDARDVLPGSYPADSARDRLRTVNVASPLAPYQDSRAYAATAAALVASGASPSARGAATTDSGSLYGGDLAAEVERLAGAAERIARATPHDVIHCHDWMTFAAGLAARRVSGRPLVLHVHSTEADRSGGGDGDARIRERERDGLVAADLVLAVSDFTRGRILEQYDVDPARVRVVHNGIDADEVRTGGLALPPLADHAPVVLFLGRLTAQKGPEWFLEAAARVHRVRPEALFVVAGTGELLPWMVERAAELGLAGRMLFTGFLSGDDIDRAYAMADVFVMPSVSEPFGLVPVEAMLRGTPAIVSRQSGVSEVIRHCLKVDFWDTEDLADKIVAVLDHAPLSQSLAAAGRAETARLGWRDPARLVLAGMRRLVQSVTEGEPR